MRARKFPDTALSSLYSSVMQILPITVLPRLPERLASLRELAENLWFSWNMEAIRMFQRLNRDLWEETDQNPVKMLLRLDQDRLHELDQDEGFHVQLGKVFADFKRYMSVTEAYSLRIHGPADYKIAYLSAEYGLTGCLPIYSGGLGVLSGDHLKAASDIRIPLVAVGLFYKEGYFQQTLDSEGWQRERYPNINFHEMPAVQVLATDGQPLRISIEIESREVEAAIWKVNVGRVPLYLLDTCLHENRVEDREITGKLYGGDKEMRLKQEIVLGIGGVRALSALGIEPAAFHMNEGHSAFCVLERMRQLRDRGLSATEAAELVRATSVFTTHTPVPAGNDTFDPALMKRYLGGYAGVLGMSFEDLLGNGRMHPKDGAEHFGMTVLALKCSVGSNGVSKLHSTVSRQMWQELWPTLPFSDLPIKALTNGVHIPSWISAEMETLYDRYLGPRWKEDPDSEKVWSRTTKIPDTELWGTHERRRERLVAFARRRLVQQLKRRGAPQSELEKAKAVLNPDALTIGFARRFATYKRATLIFSDPDRLEAILNNRERPVQLIIAGKAHPADAQGKEFIKKIIEIANNPRFRERVVFIENYDMNVARYLVQGADVWLNNPRRPLEACGTSGMKAAANGALNLSVLDGWWDEGFDGKNGWAIGGRNEYKDDEYQDQVEAKSIVDLLEKDVVPLFYDRGSDGLPDKWIEMMRNSLMSACPVFNSHRQVQDYMESFYHPAALAARALAKNDFGPLRELAAWKERISESWPRVKIHDARVSPDREVSVNSVARIETRIDLAGLHPDEVRVEAYHGHLDANENIENAEFGELHSTGQDGAQTIFCGDIACHKTGRVGIAVRITPRHDLLANPLHLNLVSWA